MRRRRLLAALPASAFALAGCLATGPSDDTSPSAERRSEAGSSGGPAGETTSGTDDGSDDTTSEQSPDGADVSPTPRTVPGDRGTATPTGTAPPPESLFPRHVAVESVDDADVRDAFGVTATVEVRDGQVTAGDTARIAVDLRTTGDGEHRLTYEQRECHRNQWRASAGEYALLALPAGNDYSRDGAYSDGELDCPVVGYANLSCGIPVVEETVTVPASGALTWAYDLWVPPSNVDRGGCVVPGTYRFAREFTADGTGATLSLALRVTAP